LRDPRETPKLYNGHGRGYPRPGVDAIATTPPHLERLVADEEGGGDAEDDVVTKLQNKPHTPCRPGARGAADPFVRDDKAGCSV